jgi:hypothetical protein
MTRQTMLWPLGVAVGLLALIGVGASVAHYLQEPYNPGFLEYPTIVAVHGEGEPLLLVHGGTATSQCWASHLPAFTEHFRVFAPDSPGHGRSLWLTPLLYTYEDLAAVIDPVLILSGDRDEGVSIAKSLWSCSGCSTMRSWPLPRPPITASSKPRWASSTHWPWIPFCGIGNEPAGTSIHRTR